MRMILVCVFRSNLSFNSKRCDYENLIVLNAKNPLNVSIPKGAIMRGRNNLS